MKTSSGGSRVWVVLRLVLLSTLTGLPGVGAMPGRPGDPPPEPWPDAVEVEDFLRTARIVERAKLGVGVTNSSRFTLERDGQTLDAVFKRVDGDYDSWRHEVAAYRLDKLLGLGMVPPTVKRQVRGTRGSLQVWVEGATMAEASGEVADVEAWRRQVSVMWLFDELIGNRDRHLANALVTPEGRLVLIDNSKAFEARRGLVLGLDRAATANRAVFWRSERDPAVETYPTHYPDGLLERLRSLPDRDLRRTLGPWVHGFRQDLVVRRRQLILRELGPG